MYRARLRLTAYAVGLGLDIRGYFIVDRVRWWWPFGRRIAHVRLWQHPAGNKLFITRMHDTQDLRLLLGFANLTGWEIIE